MDLLLFSIHSFGAWFSIIIGLGQLARPWHRNNIVPTLLFISVGLVIFYLGLMVTQEIVKVPHFLHTSIPFIYMLGPLCYFYVSMISSVDFFLRPKHIVHFLPAMLVILFLIPTWTAPYDVKLSQAQAMLKMEYAPLIRECALLGDFIICIYLALIIRDIRSLSGSKSIEARHIGILAVIWSLACSAAAYAVLAEEIRYLGITSLMTTLSIVYIYVLSQRYPKFLSQLAFEIRTRKYAAKYEKSLLKNLDLDGLDHNLKILLDEESLYTRENLSLQDVAERLCLSSHQLSQYLNEHKGMNFNSFINKYRVKAACRLLLLEPEKTVLSIAYDVGFNSLSSFNDAFRKTMGVAPSHYRKNQE